MARGDVRGARALKLLAALLASTPSMLEAQDSTSASRRDTSSVAPARGTVVATATYAPADSVTVIPGPDLGAGAVRRFFFGTDYRTLWLTPIRVPVLHLATFAGGLKVTERGGGAQTKSLRMDGADGREYQFRSLMKDPSAVLPPRLRKTVAADILRDQMSSAHPAGAVIVPELLRAAGIVHPEPILVQLADDPSLGEYRAEFGGMLGTIEERPDKRDDRSITMAGARDIEGGDEIDKKVEDDPHVPIDARAFLTSRMVDLLIGDWDRHRDQWRWALVDSGGGERWIPIPRDRDQAFVRYDGVLLSQARRVAPQLLNFDRDYSDITGATWNGRDLDRRYLTGLGRETWDSIALSLKQRITNDVIERAVRRMPPELLVLSGARLQATLRARRDHLDRVAGEYYRHLAGDVDVHASDKQDDANVVRQSDGRTLVTLAHDGKEYFRRVFTPGETDEIRIYLHGADDRLRVSGDGRGSPDVRVIGGKGDDAFDVSTRAGIHLYDNAGTNRAPGMRINGKEWDWKADSTDKLPPRDWGSRRFLLLTGYYAPDVGAVIDYGGNTQWYGFRRQSYSTRLDYHVQLSTEKRSGRFIGGITHNFENSNAFLATDLLVSGIETLRWHGFGNATDQLEDRAFYKVDHDEATLGIRVGRQLTDRTTVTIGPEIRYSRTDLDDRNRDRFIATDAPYGTGTFGMVGLAAELRADARDYPGFATRGAAIRVKASVHPKALDLVSTVAKVEGHASIAFAPPGRWQPSLNLMAGGAVTTGDIPFFHAPTIGGRRTLRGYRPDRFAGTSAWFASAETRIPVTRIKLIVPGQQGIFGFYDVGQVFVREGDGGAVRSTMGGGVWLSVLNRGNVAYVAYGKPTSGSEKGLVMVGFGFPY